MSPVHPSGAGPHTGLDPGLWDGWSQFSRQYLDAPGSQEYWERRRPLFSTRFQEYVNGFETDPEFLRTQAFARAEMSGPIE